MKQLTEENTTTLSSDTAAGLGAEPLPRVEEDHEPPEMRAAKELARRYRLEFVDLLPANQESPIDYDLFHEIPVDLMVRHQFLPLKRDGKGLHIAMADPTDLDRLDELASALAFAKFGLLLATTG